MIAEVGNPIPDAVRSELNFEARVESIYSEAASDLEFRVPKPNSDTDRVIITLNITSLL
jgi:hypothetical protein